jgi:hypothetical protein
VISSVQRSLQVQSSLKCYETHRLPLWQEHIYNWSELQKVPRERRAISTQHAPLAIKACYERAMLKALRRRWRNR